MKPLLLGRDRLDSSRKAHTLRSDTELFPHREKLSGAQSALLDARKTAGMGANRRNDSPARARSSSFRDSGTREMNPCPLVSPFTIIPLCKQ